MENVLVQQYLKQYRMMLEWVDGQLNALSDEEYNLELSPGKNTGIWILGHLVVSDDDFSVFLGKGELLFPEYTEVFGQGSKLQKAEIYPSVSKLKEAWKKVSEKNLEIYSGLTDKELNEPHSMVKNYETDYFKTKDKVIMAWHLHQAYHAGQIAILVSRVGKNKY